MALVPVPGAVVALSASLGHHVDDRSRVLPVLGLVVPHQDLDLGDGVEVHHVLCGPKSAVVRHDAVDRHGYVVAPDAADDRRVGSSKGPRSPARVVRDAGKGLEHLHVVASPGREQHHLPVVQHRRALLARELDRGRLRLNGNRLVLLTDFEHQVAGRQPFRSRQDEVLLFQPLEARHLHRYRILARLHRRKDKTSRLIGHSIEFHAGLVMHENHLGAGYDSSLLVDDPSADHSR